MMGVHVVHIVSCVTECSSVHPRPRPRSQDDAFSSIELISRTNLWVIYAARQIFLSNAIDSHIQNCNHQLPREDQNLLLLPLLRR
jgi:hypothetical protein